MQAAISLIIPSLPFPVPLTFFAYDLPFPAIARAALNLPSVYRELGARHTRTPAPALTGAVATKQTPQIYLKHPAS